MTAIVRASIPKERKVVTPEMLAQWEMSNAVESIDPVLSHLNGQVISLVKAYDCHFAKPKEQRKTNIMTNFVDNTTVIQEEITLILKQLSAFAVKCPPVVTMKEHGVMAVTRFMTNVTIEWISLSTLVKSGDLPNSRDVARVLAKLLVSLQIAVIGIAHNGSWYVP